MCYKLKSVHFKSHVTPPPPLPFCKVHASCITFRLNQASCTSPFLPSENHVLFWCHTPPSLLPSLPSGGPPPLPSSFSDSSPKACRDMKPLVFKRDNNNSKVILIIDSHLEHRPTFKCLYYLLIHTQDDLWLLNLTLSNNSLWKMWSWCVICSQFVEKDWRQTFSMRNLYVTWLKSVGE